jgi:ATP-dependent Clp protease adaptor protein ClpS
MPIETHIDSVVLEEKKLSTPPPFYQVIMLNDDFTPMDFVVRILIEVFDKTEDESVQIMLAIHHHGRGICGQYIRDVAETKVAKVKTLAQQEEHPLKCIMEAL